MNNFINDIILGGIINISLLVIYWFITYKWISYNGYFNEFTSYHYMLWSIFSIIQGVYLFYILMKTKRESHENEIYLLFTKGDLIHLKNIINYSDIYPLYGIIPLIIALLLPHPINKSLSKTTRMLIVLSKIGIIHIISYSIKKLNI